MPKAARERPPVLTISHSRFPLFPSIEASSKVFPTQSSLWVFTEAWSKQLRWSRQPESSPFLMAFGRLVLHGRTDLLFVKDGQINTLGIPDKIRPFRAGSDLHMTPACPWFILIRFPAICPVPCTDASSFLLLSTKKVNNREATVNF